MKTAVKELPILFGDAMVRALLDGRKTQTRRPFKPQPEFALPEAISWHWDAHSRKWGAYQAVHDDPEDRLLRGVFKGPFGKPGDVLWVRECFGLCYCGEPSDMPTFEHEGWSMETLSRSLGPKSSLVYRADGKEHNAHWRPSIHMPRWASRISLRVKRVWVERVQEISEVDAYAEGVTIPEPWSFQGRDCYTPEEMNLRNEARCTFTELWNSIYAKRGLGWDANPWVWACEFEVLS